MEKYSHEDQEALMFNSYPCAYYVQSPSTVSHANSAAAAAADIRTTNNTHINTIELDHSANFHYSPTPTFLNKNPEVSRFTLSRYSSSRGSNNSSFLQHDPKKINVGAEINRLIIIDHGVDEQDDGDEEDQEAEGYYMYGKKRGWWWRYCSFRRSNSCAWISLQLCWRLVLSFAVALLVFCIATKPPPPNISIKMAGVPEFVLGEGVDASGVATKILTCNCSIHLLIDNKSKLFGLHVHPPIMDIFFGRLPFAMSRGPKLYAQSLDLSIFELYVGTRNKPMYGAGRSMQDLLESGMGLPLQIRLKLTSNFRVVWNLINPTFHHDAHCFLLLIHKNNHPYPTQIHNTTCTITS